MEAFSSTDHAIKFGYDQEFLLHTLCKVMWGDFLIVCPVFFREKSFFYTPHAVLCGKSLLQFYVPRTSLCGEFLLHTPC